MKRRIEITVDINKMKIGSFKEKDAAEFLDKYEPAPISDYLFMGGVLKLIEESE